MAGFLFHDICEAAEARLRPVRAVFAALRFRRAALGLSRALKHNFNPDQPRVPAGQSGGGRWTGSTGFRDGLARVAANGDGPLVPGGTYSIPVGRNPLDQAGINQRSLSLADSKRSPTQ